MLEALVDCPPPAMLLEQVHYKLCIVSFADKPFVELELAAFKVKFDFVALIYYIIQLLESL